MARAVAAARRYLVAVGSVASIRSWARAGAGPAATRTMSARCWPRKRRAAGHARGGAGADPDQVAQVLAQEAAAAGPVGGELGGLGDQGQGGGLVAGGVLDQGGVDQSGGQLLEGVDLPCPGQGPGGQVAGGDQVALPGQDQGEVAAATDGQVVAAVGQVPGDRLF